jgi:predicted transcriptional regulator
VKFKGFSNPKSNYFKMPNEWTDITAEMTSLSLLKVVEYTIRHTWGFQEYGIAKKITIDEYMNGRKRKDGSRMDKGTGLSKQSVITALRKAVEDGLLIEEIDDSDTGRKKRYYGPAIVAPAECNDPYSDVKDLDPDVKDLDLRGQRFRHRTEKETIERNHRKGDEKDFLDALVESEDYKLKQNEPLNYLIEVVADLLNTFPPRDGFKLEKFWMNPLSDMVENAKGSSTEEKVQCVERSLRNLAEDNEGEAWFGNCVSPDSLFQKVAPYIKQGGERRPIVVKVDPPRQAVRV